MSAKTLANWVHFARSGKLAEMGENRKPVTDLEAENSRLRRELAEVKMERDLLKKATADAPESHCKVRVHEDHATPLSTAADESCIRRIAERLPRLEDAPVIKASPTERPSGVAIQAARQRTRQPYRRNDCSQSWRQMGFTPGLGGSSA